jgi:uncharacterized protein YlzI (FlbEa/FlbD family)
MLNRINPLGLRYVIYVDTDPNKTVISLSGKRIIVDCSLEEISERWYNWQMKGQLIQHAFNNLTDSQREFLMTGLTDAEWDEAFKDESESK